GRHRLGPGARPGGAAVARADRARRLVRRPRLAGPRRPDRLAHGGAAVPPRRGVPRRARRMEALLSAQPALSVVIPAFNERETIARVIERVQALGIDTQIVVVDDCSGDGTAEIVAGLPGVELLRHDRN